MYLNDKEFRAKISLYTGLGINCFYALFKCGTGIMFRSAWLWAIEIYYVMLTTKASIRAALILQTVAAMTVITIPAVTAIVYLKIVMKFWKIARCCKVF